MIIRTVRIGGVSLPIPADWRTPDGGTSYVGDEGLMDPRMAMRDPRDVERVRAEIERVGGQINTGVLQGCSCLQTSFRRPGVAVYTYSFDRGDGMEVRAVYVLRDGNEEAVAAIRAAIETTAPTPSSRLDPTRDGARK